jgi:CRP/FNR family transcriptional regulator, cyclic AMP receptor protein
MSDEPADRPADPRADATVDPRADPLAVVAILGCLDAAARARVARLCRLSRFPAGAGVIGEDREGQEVVFVLEGRVRVIGRTESGRLVSFAEIGAGGHVGELAALDGGPRTADVEAITDCRVAILQPRAFTDLLHAHPCIAVALLRELARVIRTADLRITELSTMGAAERLARELLRRAVPGPGADGSLLVEPMPTQEQLASVTGATRETVARLLAQLQHSGVTRRTGSRLAILDVARLEEIGAGRRL